VSGIVPGPADHGADLDVRFHQWPAEAEGKRAVNVRRVHVADQVFGKADPSLLENQHVGAAAGAVEAFRRPLRTEHPGKHLAGVLVMLSAVALDDFTDHHRHYLNHGDQPYPASPGDIGIEDGDDPLVLGIGADGYFAASDIPAFLEHTKKVVYPRQVAMYLVKELTDASFPEIGRAFGGKDCRARG